MAVSFNLPSFHQVVLPEDFSASKAYSGGVESSQKQEQQRIANALKQLEHEYAPEQYQQEAADRGLNIGRKEIENKYLEREKEADLAYKLAQAGYYEKGGARGAGAGGRGGANTGLHAWRSMPTNVRNHLIAVGNAHGLSADKITTGMIEGKDLQEILAENGIEYDPNLLPQYPPTGVTQSRNQRSVSALAEMDVFDNKIKESLSRYGFKLGSLSPQLLKDAIKGGKENDEMISQYIAATGVGPELAALRIGSMGGNIGHGAIESVLEKSLMNNKFPAYLATPERMRRSQEILNEWLNEAANAGQRALYKQPGQAKPGSQQSIAGSLSEASSAQPMHQVKNKKTGKIEYITEERAKELGFIS